MLAATTAESPWVWEARPDVWLLVLALVGGYWWSVTRLRSAFAAPPPRAAELVRYGVTSNALAPSARTRMTEEVFTKFSHGSQGRFPGGKFLFLLFCFLAFLLC